MKKLYERACAGDAAFFKMLLEYTDGRPSQKIDMTVEKINHPLANSIDALIEENKKKEIDK